MTRVDPGPLLVTLALFGLGLLLAWMQIAPVLNLPADAPDRVIAFVVLEQSTLARMATALLCGAALALAGSLFQQVLRNPLASPTTLGISAGANLALVVATLWFPALIGFGRDLVALSGSALAAILVFLLGARRGFSPLTLVISGLVISLWCGGLSAVLMLLNERYLTSLSIWGAGSLSQQSWDTPIALGWKLAAIGGVSALLVRPLTLLDLGEEGARAVGLKPERLRLFAVALAVLLAALVTSAVGVIGFIGLVAPVIARLSGARRPGALLLWSTLIGAALLFFADNLLMQLTGLWPQMLPTGAFTAIFGSPLLLLLLPRLKTRHRIAELKAAPLAPLLSARHGLLLAMALGVTILFFAVLVGRNPLGGWSLLQTDLWSEILPLRFPRILAACIAGALLATAGIILQRLTGNEMASPEVLGVSAGATLGVTLAIFFTTEPGIGFQLVYSTLGAAAVLAVVFLFALKSGLAPERVLLAGIALSAMADAIGGAIGATGDPRTIFLLRWMSGSTYAVGMETASAVTVVGIVLVSVALLVHRWLDLLPLGPSAAKALGINIKAARLTLLLLAGCLTAAATLCVGPLTFIGLMAPHLARELGLRQARTQLLGGLVIGGGLMMLADWIGRVSVFPYEIPAGLVSALIGAPFLILMMRRRA